MEYGVYEGNKTKVNFRKDVTATSLKDLSELFLCISTLGISNIVSIICSNLFQVLLYLSVKIASFMCVCL